MLFVERQVVIGGVWLDGSELNSDELNDCELNDNELANYRFMIRLMIISGLTSFTTTIQQTH